MNCLLPGKRVKNRHKKSTASNLNCLISVSQPIHKAKRGGYHSHPRYQAKYSDRYHFSFTAFIAAKVQPLTKFVHRIAPESHNCKCLCGTEVYHPQQPMPSNKTV